MPPLATLPILEVRAATPRSRIVRIATPNGTFSFQAGQAVLVGTHGHPLRKPYSIASAPEDASCEAMVELLVGVGDSGSPGPHLEHLERGVLVDVEGPVGSFRFPDDTDARHFLFLAGGLGISPLRSMLRHALAILPASGAPPPIGLIYSARTTDEFAYLDEFERLAADGRIRLMLTITRAADSTAWTGARGRINMTHLQQMVPHRDTLCFICGPRAFVDDIQPRLREAGVGPDRIRIDEW